MSEGRRQSSKTQLALARHTARPGGVRFQERARAGTASSANPWYGTVLSKALLETSFRLIVIPEVSGCYSRKSPFATLRRTLRRDCDNLGGLCNTPTRNRVRHLGFRLIRMTLGTCNSCFVRQPVPQRAVIPGLSANRKLPDGVGVISCLRRSIQVPAHSPQMLFCSSHRIGSLPMRESASAADRGCLAGIRLIPVDVRNTGRA